jgi:acyl homoserine lactone synthase
MILVIDALNRSRFEAVLEDMFELRARVFGGRLGWEVEVTNGQERDAFDDLDPAYVVGLDGDGRVVSCARLLQTTGPHMLADVFHAILDGEPPPRSPHLWESTRFCVDTARLHRGAGEGSVSRATCELMVATLEFARRSGVADIVTVIDPVMDRVLKRSDNAPYDYVGRTAPMGKVSAMAALLDCTEERIARVRAFAGLTGEVLLDDDAALALLARAGRAVPPAQAHAQAQAAAGPVAGVPRRVGSGRVARRSGADLRAAELRTPVRAGDIYTYCVDQIRSARSEAEREAAFAVVRELLDRACGQPEKPMLH